jgi:biopolymer transport protein ExbD
MATVLRVVTLLALAGAGAACGQDSAQAALAQRVDLLERRLDAVETAQATAQATAAKAQTFAAPIALIPENAPPTAEAPSTMRDPVLRVDIGRGGITIDGVAVADDAIEATLRSHAARRNLSGVILSADDDIAYDAVIALMDRLKASGLDRVAIAARGGARPPE